MTKEQRMRHTAKPGLILSIQISVDHSLCLL
ncbi:hypothetical protein L0N02_00610 [Blautia faecis]|nr:hypothetical protein [Blautia faecis]